MSSFSEIRGFLMTTKEQILSAINYPYIVNQCNSSSNTNNLRKGQMVFNACYRIYGDVVSQVQLIDKVDCFYNDNYIDNFLDKLSERLSKKYTKETHI